jgi:hypothetical protein
MSAFSFYLSPSETPLHLIIARMNAVVSGFMNEHLFDSLSRCAAQSLAKEPQIGNACAPHFENTLNADAVQPSDKNAHDEAMFGTPRKMKSRTCGREDLASHAFNPIGCLTPAVSGRGL